MSPEKLLEDLTRRGIALHVVGDQLKWKADPRSRVTSATIALLRAHKLAIIRLLRSVKTGGGNGKQTALQEPPDKSDEMEQRGALYTYARGRGCPALSLPFTRIVIAAGEAAWSVFALEEGQIALWEAALLLDDVPEVRP